MRWHFVCKMSSLYGTFAGRLCQVIFVRSLREKKMNLIHVALSCKSEENSDRFYHSLLNLDKLNVKTLPTELSKQLFQRDEEITYINYGNEQIHFEIFVSDGNDYADNQLSHTCIEVENRSNFLKRCEAAGLEVRKASKNGSTIVFIKDFDGNLFEVKES